MLGLRPLGLFIACCAQKNDTDTDKLAKCDWEIEGVKINGCTVMYRCFNAFISYFGNVLLFVN